MKKVFCFTFWIILCLYSTGQQLPISDQAYINLYDLSPAYSGHNNNFETFISYRKSWLGIEGAPEVKKMSINGRLADNMGIGGTIVSDEIGIFRSNTALLSYAYKVNFPGDKLLSFGLDAGIFENHIDLSDAQSEGTDMLAESNQNISKITFLSDFGVSFIVRGLYTGIVIPRLLETKMENDNGTAIYTLKRHYQFHIGYSYYLHRDWEVKPMVLCQKSISSPVFYEIGTIVRYKDMIWMNLAYRKTTSFVVGFGGVIYDKLSLNYAYEFSGNGMLGQSSGTHEVSLGVLIGNQQNSQTSVFGAGANYRNKPYFGW